MWDTEFMRTLTELIAKITPLPWADTASDDDAPDFDYQPNWDYARHAANVLPELVKALRELDESTRHAARMRCTSCGEKLEAAEQREVDAYLGASAALDNAENVETK